MPIPSNPEFLESVIGASADVLPIPAQDYTDPTQNGALNYATGWPAITALPLEAGGKAPRREYFNALARLLSSHIFFQQSGSLYPWSATLDYLSGAHVLGSDGKEYIAQKSSGPDVPDSSAVDPVGDQSGTWLEPGSVYAPLATTQKPGIVQVGNGLSVTAQGVLSASSLLQTRRAATTLYVRADGNDSRDGLTVQTSLKTIRRAQQRMKELDTASFEVTIDVGAGAFDVSGLDLGRTTLSSPRATLRGQGATTVLSVSSGYLGFTVGAWWLVQNLKILLAKDTYVNNMMAFLRFIDTTFAVSGVSTEPHLATTFNGVTNLDSGCAFTGSSECAVSADSGGVVRIMGNISINGVFSLATMSCNGGSVILRAVEILPTISGTSTGPRYAVSTNGVIRSVGGGPNWIPGSQAGTATNGGIYV